MKASKIPGCKLKNRSVAKVSGSENPLNPEKTSLQGDVEEPVLPFSSGTIQLKPKFLFGSTP